VCARARDRGRPRPDLDTRSCLLRAGTASTSGRRSRRSRPIATELLLEINGTELFIKRIDSGDPLIVVHGGPVLEHGYLLPHFEPLAEHYELIFYDQRLSGRSAATVEPSTVRAATFVDDIETIRQTLDLGPVHLAGHSWGGFLAMQYAIRYPDNLRSLLLLDSMAASSELWQAEQASQATQISPETQAEIASLRDTAAFQQRRPEAIAAMLTLSFRPQFSDPSHLSELQLYVPADYVSRCTQFGAMMIGLEAFDFHAELSELDVRTLVLYGADEAGAKIGGAEIAATIPGARFELIPNAGHFPFIENQAAFVAAVLAFLQV